MMDSAAPTGAAAPTSTSAVQLQQRQFSVKHKAKVAALEFMILRIYNNDPLWKVVDLEEYTMENPDVVVTDQHIHNLAIALNNNDTIVALRIPESEGLVSWNALWPLFESIKNNKSITRLFIASSGKIFGHAASVFFGNSILGFFETNYCIRTLGSFSQSELLKRSVRMSLNRNILYHYVPKKLLVLRMLWSRTSSSSASLSESANDALSLLYQFDEHLSMIRSLAMSIGTQCPYLISSSSNNKRIKLSL
jgi:hypothetical protein